MRKLIVGAITALMVVSLNAFAQDYEGQTVGTIKVSGLERISEQVVLAKIEVQTGQPYNGRAVARDIRRLYDLGYFSHIKAEVALGSSGVDLTYVVKEKRFIEKLGLAAK